MGKPEQSPLDGQQFSRLQVLHRVAGDPKVSYLCQCECGTLVQVQKSNLTTGNTKSCGCYKSESSLRRFTKHGHAKGRAVSPEYFAWQHMRSRCENPHNNAYADYGARGITFAPEFVEFAAFFAVVGPRPSPDHSLNRIDNNGNYEPGNIEWATKVAQMNNTRRSVTYEYNGERRPLKEWAHLLGIKRSTLAQRIHGLKWSVEKAFGTPNLRTLKKP